MNKVTSLHRRFWRVGLGAAIGILVALMAYLLIPQKFEAVGLVEIGRIGGRGAIESIPSMISRMRTLATVQAVAKEVGLPATDIETDRIVANTKLSPGGDYMEIRALAKSKEGAIALVQAYFDQTQLQHERIAAPILADEKEALAENRERVLAEDKVLAQSIAAHDKHSESELMILAESQSLRAALLARELDLERQMHQPETAPTQLAGPIAVSERPVFPSKALLLGIGAMVGLTVALALIWGPLILEQ